MPCLCSCRGSNPFILGVITIAVAAASVVLFIDDDQDVAGAAVRKVALTDEDIAPRELQQASVAAGISADFMPTVFFEEVADVTKLETATFGGGCFWGMEGTFRKVEGVTHTAVGFCGGEKPDPSYKEVCYEDTGHVEVVHLQFDPDQVSYERLLEVFWKIHDPTQVNRQGPDVGTQYRTAIFVHGDAQRAAAEKSKIDLQASSLYKGRTIATEISDASSFYKAEDYHQQYLQKNGLDNCHVPQ